MAAEPRPLRARNSSCTPSACRAAPGGGGVLLLLVVNATDALYRFSKSKGRGHSRMTQVGQAFTRACTCCEPAAASGRGAQARAPGRRCRLLCALGHAPRGFQGWGHKGAASSGGERERAGYTASADSGWEGRARGPQKQINTAEGRDTESGGHRGSQKQGAPTAAAAAATWQQRRPHTTW